MGGRRKIPEHLGKEPRGGTARTRARRQAIGTLEESRHPLGQLLENATDVIWTVDLNLQPTYISPSVTALLGYTPEEAKALAVARALAPPSRQVVQAVVAEELAFYAAEHRDPPRPRRVEIELIRKDGSTVWTESTARLLRDPDGRPVGVLGLTRDITERKRLDEALRRAHEELAIRNRIAHIFLTVPDDEMYGEVLEIVLQALQSRHGIFGYIDEQRALVCPSMTRDVWDQCRVPDKDIVFPRDTWGGIWGRALAEGKTHWSNEPFTVPQGHIPMRRALAVPIVHQGESIGLLHVANKATDYDDSDRALLETIAESIAPILHARLQRDRQERARRSAEESVRKARDELEVRVAQRTSQLTEANKSLRKEIGERKRVEEALRRVEQEEATILNGMSELVVYLDVEMRVVWANRAAAEAAGADPKQLEGRRCYQIWQQRSEPCADCPVVKARETGQPETGEMVTPDGRLWFIRANPVRNADGDVAGIVEVTNEITERKRAEDELRASEERLRTVVTNAPVILFAHDREGVYTLSEGKGLAALGLEPGQRVGRSVFDVYHDREDVHANVRRSLAGEALSTTFQRAGRVFDLRLTPVRDEEGEVSSVIGVATDVTERTRAEEALRESEERYRLLLESTSDSVYVLDPEWRHVIVNQAAERFVGIPREKLLGATLLKTFPGIEQTTFFRTFERVMSTRRPDVVVDEFTFADGRKGWYEVHVDPVPEGILCISRDITERKRAEEALRRQREEQQIILDSVPALIFYKDRDNRFIRVNRALVESLGLSREQMEGGTAFELFPEHAEEYWRDDLEVMESGRAKRGIVEPVETSAGTRWVRTDKIPYVDENGDIVGVVGFSADITERKQAEDALRESEERYRAIFEQAADAVVLIDGQTGELLEFNDRAYENLGYTREEFRRLALHEIDAIESGDDVARRVQKILDQGGDVFETKHRAKSGEIRDVQVSSRAISIGGSDFLLSMWRDITERKRAEQELEEHRHHLADLVEQRTAEVTALNKELEAFVHSVSHDLRAPLRSIDGFSRVLLEDHVDKLDAPARDSLQRVRGATQHMRELIDNLLALSRVTQSEIHLETVDLSALAKTVAAELQEGEPERRVTFEIEEGLSVTGDASLLRAALENLLGNAWKSTRDGVSARIEFGSTQSGSGLAYFVRDNGIGFDMTDADRLFDPFQRLHPESEFPGTGVGLATVQRVVRRHSGHVWAEGSVGLGATFSFTLGTRRSRHRRRRRQSAAES